MKTGACICAVLVLTAAVISGCFGPKILPVPNPSDPALLVDYQRTGGFAGSDDRLVIFDNGIALVRSRTTSREIQLNQSDLENISAVFAAAQFATLEGNYTSGRQGADFMQYSITFRGKTVNTEDTALPPALEPVILEMNRIVSAGLKNGQADLSLPDVGSS
jgi:hypothetical protein